MTLFTRLAAEWPELGASPPAVTALGTWAREDPPFHEFADLCDLVRFVQRSRNRANSDELLACLAARAQSDPYAARALFQVVFYGLIRIAADFRTATHSDEEIASVVIAAAYERIRTYPIDRRPRSIAANVLLDTRQAVSRSVCRPRVLEVPTADIEKLVVEASETPASDELLGIIDEAVRTRRLRVADARLILLSRLADMPTIELAETHSCTPHSVRRRRLRAEAVLKAAAACVA
jgi:hypothetical protein